MKPLLHDIFTALFMGLILPGLMLNWAAAVYPPQEAAPLQETLPQQTLPETVSVPMRLRYSNGKTQEMDMEDYLVGVVLAEMPVSFELEALKAQAVAARTYTRKAWETGGKHGDGSVCRESGCCQAYLPEDAYLEQGGTQEALDKVRRAVALTSGQVLTYQGELIEATYFSCSGGSTEDAAAVWGTDFPYLRSVESPGEESAAHYTDTVTFTPQQFQNALGTELTGYPKSWFGTATYTAGGGVATMTIGGEAYSGTELRSLLGLASTNFTITPGANLIITTYGYGHRVGMSQYGADAMAVTGSTYDEILSHYYPGTVLAGGESPLILGPAGPVQSATAEGGF